MENQRHPNRKIIEDWGVYGQRVKMITTKQQFTNGVHRLTWNGRNTGNEEISSGIYHLKVKLGELTIFRKIVYSK